LAVASPSPRVDGVQGVKVETGKTYGFTKGGKDLLCVRRKKRKNEMGKRYSVVERGNR